LLLYPFALVNVINPAQKLRLFLKLHRIGRKQYPPPPATTNRHLHFEITHTTIAAQQLEKLVIDLGRRKKRCSLTTNKLFGRRSDHLDAAPRGVTNDAVPP
jgi:hypothetical protein